MKGKHTSQMLKRQEGYILKHIDQKTYLLPYGQKIADLKKGVQLNESGEFIWNALAEPQSLCTLQDLLSSEYALDADSKAQLCDDVAQFVKELLQFGILREDLQLIQNNPYKTIQLADCRIRLMCPADAFPEQFHSFILDPDSASGDSDMDIEIIFGQPRSHQNGTILIRNKELVIIQWEEGYILQFPTLENIFEAYITTDGTYARIYCCSFQNESDRENLFLAIRPCFLYKAQLNGCFAIHSASILYQNQAWLFSGHSGMGKSTHTALWHKIVHTPYLNGDLNLIGIKEGIPVVYGIPWCGTSHIFTEKTYSLGGIILLGRDTTDHVITLKHHEKILQVMQRMISPSWSATLMERNLDFAANLVAQVPVYKLLCTKEASAVKVIKKEIDSSFT